MNTEDLEKQLSEAQGYLSEITLEARDLPSRISAAGALGKVKLARELQQRQQEMPGDLFEAQQNVLQARSNLLDAKIKNDAIVEAAAKERLERAAVVLKAAQTEFDAAQLAYTSAFACSFGPTNERHQIGEQMRRGMLEYSLSLSDEPQRVTLDAGGRLSLLQPEFSDETPGEMVRSGNATPVSEFNGRSEIGRKQPATQSWR